MNKLLSTLIAALFAAVSVSAIAADAPKKDEKAAAAPATDAKAAPTKDAKAAPVKVAKAAPAKGAKAAPAKDAKAAPAKAAEKKEEAKK